MHTAITLHFIEKKFIEFSEKVGNALFIQSHSQFQSSYVVFISEKFTKVFQREKMLESALSHLNLKLQFYCLQHKRGVSI